LFHPKNKLGNGTAKSGIKAPVTETAAVLQQLNTSICPVFKLSLLQQQNGL
jgi:hypothetical protein